MKDVIYVDMDGVVADFDKRIKDAHPEIEIDMKDEIWRDLVENYCESNPRIFTELELIDGAKEAIELLDEKFELYFLSTPMYNVPESYMDKRLWLETHFPTISNKKLILTHNKGLCIGKYLIDDRIKHGVDKFCGEHIHFGSKKFPDWKSVLKYLL